MKKRSQNFIALRELRDEMRILELQDIEDNAHLYVFARFMELFQEFEVPVECVGNMNIQVSNEFFESKKLAEEIMVSITKQCKNVYTIILDRVQDEEVAKKILSDFISKNSGLCWFGLIEEEDNSGIDFDGSEW